MKLTSDVIVYKAKYLYRLKGNYYERDASVMITAPNFTEATKKAISAARRISHQIGDEVFLRVCELREKGKLR